MSTATAEPPLWSRRKWWGVVLGLIALQVLLLTWFGARGPIKPRSVTAAPQLRFAPAAAGEWTTLTDPTLFAQGHPQGFSGGAWMTIPVPEYQPPEWSEPPRWLALDAQQLGADFRRFVQTNRPFALASIGKPEPQLTLPKTLDEPLVKTSPSALHIEGELAGRRLLNPPELKPQTFPDLLTNSVVQVLVDDEGNVLSPVLITGSGKPTADGEALAVAKSLQFEPLPRKSSGPDSVAPLTWGTLVFEWQTLPLPATNAPAGNP